MVFLWAPFPPSSWWERFFKDGVRFIKFTLPFFESWRHLRTGPFWKIYKIFLQYYLHQEKNEWKLNKNLVKVKTLKIKIKLLRIVLIYFWKKLKIQKAPKSFLLNTQSMKAEMTMKSSYLISKVYAIIIIQNIQLENYIKFSNKNLLFSSFLPNSHQFQKISVPRASAICLIPIKNNIYQVNKTCNLSHA